MTSGPWKFLASLKLGLGLLILIIILSIIGTLIPQGQAPEFYRQHLRDFSGLIRALDFDHLYRSPLFLSLIFLFLLNLLFCSWLRLPAKFRRLRIRDESLLASGQPPAERRDRARLERWLSEDLLQLAVAFKKKGYRVRTTGNEDEKIFLARKSRPGLFGPELVHLGLMIIIAGGLISALFSQRISVALTEGQTEKIPGQTFSLRLDRFTTEYYPDGSVKDWKSLVSVLENGQVKLQKTIEVNHPLKYRRLGFFQMSYGQDWDRTELGLEISLPGVGTRIVNLKAGETREAGDNLMVKAPSFIPDFAVDEAGRAFSRSPEPANPAAMVEIMAGGNQVFVGWVFSRHPEISRYQRSTLPGMKVNLKSFSAPPFSVLEAAYDPGANLVWSGSLLLVLGLLISFYLPYREVRICQRTGQPPLYLVYTRKNPAAFRREVDQWLGLTGQKGSKDETDE
ncbi:MAG: cytochrome c biogenesis protein ResB [Candidatus Saccharicenans sp.]|nr:cytochrome c biogenesis protein ResB [Candidatus Saccharicenans sp.]